MPPAPLTVLVADDTAANRNMMQVFLKKLGYAAVFAVDGADAVQAFEREQPDLVLMDLMMPEMDGFEATRRIRGLQGGAWTPIVIMSALNADADVVAGLDAGADDYLVKPISFTVFAAKMRTMKRLLSMERGQRELLGRMRAISDAVIDGIVTMDEKGIIQSANPAACRMFGHPDGVLVGKNVSVLMPTEHADAHDGYLRDYLTGGPAKVIGHVRELAGKRASGECFPLELGVTELKLDQRRLFIGVVRDISERVRVRNERAENAARLQRYHDEQQREQELARQIMFSQVDTDALRDPRIHFSVMPAENFSGDLVAAACSPQGRLYAMLADATGHGLAAAVSVQPVLPLFYTLVANDAPLTRVVRGLNDLLHQSLPVGRFVGAALVCLEPDGTQGEVWVGGVPEVLLLGTDGKVRRRFASSQLPLGVVESSREGCEPAACALSHGEQLVLFSDGVVEAADVQDRAFGMARFEGILAASPIDARLAAIRHALAQHLAGASAHDDMSLLLLDATPLEGRAGLLDPAI